MIASISASIASDSLWPSGPKILIPLSWNGLCDAEMTTPKSARSDGISIATAGVGIGPARTTSMPMAVKPAVMADSIMYPDRRVSLPMTTVWRCRPRRRRWAVAMLTRREVQAVIGSALAVPRMPSVPNRVRVMGLDFLKSAVAMVVRPKPGAFKAKQ